MGEGEHPLQERIQPIHFSDDDVGIFLQGRRERGLRLNELCSPPDPHQRITDLMGNTCDQCSQGREALCPADLIFQLSNPRDVPKEQDSPPGLSALVSQKGGDGAH